MLIPLKTENRLRTFPVITILLITANVLAFLYQNFGMEASGVIVARMGIIPMEFFYFETFNQPGRLPFYVTLFTAMFLHADILHLTSNMLFLWIFGKDMEAALGHLYYLFFYIICGIIASAAHIFANIYSTTFMIGASGAIAGVLGAYFIRFPGTKVYNLVFLIFFFRIVSIPAFIVLGYWFLLQVLESTMTAPGMGGVAWFAHIGGFMCGLFWMLQGMKKRYLKNF